MTVHVCMARPTEIELRREHCPTCERRPWFVAAFEAWYGWTSTCLRCGDTWTDGEPHGRPWAPKWRERSIASAFRQWRRAHNSKRVTRSETIRAHRPNLYRRQK